MRLSSTAARAAARLAAGIAAVMALAACEPGTDPKPQVAARLDIVSGDDQEARVGTELSSPLVVKVTDDDGRPVRGQIVNFVVVSGGGSVFAGTAQTNEQGEARERWTLGTSTAAADSQRVEARAVDAATGAALVFATFSATATPDVPATVMAVGAVTRTGAAGSVVADSLAVRVADRYGNPVPNVDVAWTASGGGSVSPASSRTDAAGVAKSRWTLGGTAGAQTATAAVTGAGSASFTATVGAATAARVTILPTMLSFATLGRQAQVTVSAADAFGNPISAEAMLVSRNAAVASLEGTGTVQARGNGSTYLVATVQGVSDSIPVQVSQVAATVTVAPASATIFVGDTVRYTAAAADSAGNAIANPQFAWRTVVSTVATVDASGLVTGAGGGSTSVVAKTGTVEGSATVNVQRALTATAIDAGGHHTCAVSSGSTFCWGSNVTRQLGTSGGTTGTPQQAAGGIGLSLLSAGGPGIASGVYAVGQSCGATSSGAVYCWGNDIMRQLSGPPAAENCRLSSVYSYPCRPEAAAVPGLFDMIYLTSGALHTCAANSAGEAYCWGSDRFGELGTTAAVTEQCRVEGSSGTLVPCSGTPLRVAGARSYKEISAGASFTCALAAGGEAFCWGLGNNGQLGLSGVDTTSVPVAVQGGHQFTRISSGTAHTCGIRTDERLLCWGAGGAGQLGNGSTANSAVPVLVAGNLAFRSVASGAEHTCATTTGGAAYCWGNGANGELGAGSGVSQSSFPVAVAGGLSFTRLTAGVDHTCGISASAGAVYCWGSRSRGAVGGDIVSASYFTPQQVRAP